MIVRRIDAVLWIGPAALAIASCQNSAPIDSVAALPTVSAWSSSTADAGVPRRPSRRHFLARAEDRCEVFSIEGDQVSSGERIPCPQDLEVGERIRVAGKTCVREGRPERRRPVVCPGPLLSAEEKLRESRDGGEGAPK